MNRTESDLRDALTELERRADEAGAPSVADVLAAVEVTRARTGGRHRGAGGSRTRLLAPLAAAAVVAAAAVGVAVVASQRDDRPAGPGTGPAATQTQPDFPSTSPNAAPSTDPTASDDSTGDTSATSAATVLADAADRAEADTTWREPAPSSFFYVRTTDATTWTSVSGRQTGLGRTSDGTPISMPGCAAGQRTPDSGEGGACTLNDVPHYRANAPTEPDAWDRYLEQMAPGAKAGGAQGKIIVQVLHSDLLAPKATAALLRFTEGCPGLHTIAVDPRASKKLVGVTCTSMSAGSYGLAFDATTHAFVGFVPVDDQSGEQYSPAEIVLRTGIVPERGQLP